MRLSGWRKGEQLGQWLQLRVDMQQSRRHRTQPQQRAACSWQSPRCANVLMQSPPALPSPLLGHQLLVLGILVALVAHTGGGHQG